MSQFQMIILKCVDSDKHTFNTIPIINTDKSQVVNYTWILTTVLLDES